MGFIKKCLISQLLMAILFVGLNTVSQAAEMDVDVGIEFSAIDPEPKPDPPEKPPKKIIQLPQTGETKTQGFTAVGVLLIVTAGAFIYKKESGRSKK